MEPVKNKTFVCFMIGKICTSVLHLTPGSPDTSCLGQAKCQGPSPCLSRRLGIQEQPCRGENCTIWFLNGWNFKNSRKFSFIPDIASSIFYLIGCRISWSAVLAACSNSGRLIFCQTICQNDAVCLSYFIGELRIGQRNHNFIDWMMTSDNLTWFNAMM